MIKKSEAKYTEPFKGKKNVIVMISVQDGISTASSVNLNYDTVHALEKAIVEATFDDDIPMNWLWK